jgi:hypothetical protein
MKREDIGGFGILNPKGMPVEREDGMFFYSIDEAEDCLIRLAYLNNEVELGYTLTYDRFPYAE